MSRYRKIEVKTWSDNKFRELSAIPPCAQGLWFFLLTGPHTSPIPGLFRAGRAAMAEELEWELEAFDKAFTEVLDKGMAKADFKARIVWLPKALKHNKPESPNVVRSWHSELSLLPDCELKTEAIEAILEELKSIGSPYVDAFNDALGKTFVKPSIKASIKASTKPISKTMPNQEQEQEQEREEMLASTNISIPIFNPVPVENHPPPEGVGTRTRRIGTKTPLPTDFCISDRVRLWAEAKGYDELEKHLEVFVSKVKMHGYKYVDWDSAFQNAIRDNWAQIQQKSNLLKVAL